MSGGGVVVVFGRPLWELEARPPGMEPAEGLRRVADASACPMFSVRVAALSLALQALRFPHSSGTVQYEVVVVGLTMQARWRSAPLAGGPAPSHVDRPSVHSGLLTGDGPFSTTVGFLCSSRLVWGCCAANTRNCSIVRLAKDIPDASPCPVDASRSLWPSGSRPLRIVDALDSLVGVLIDGRSSVVRVASCTDCPGGGDSEKLCTAGASACPGAHIGPCTDTFWWCGTTSGR